MRLASYTRSRKRRGVILMVVLALLTLFAIIGVTFVLYATSEETASRVAKDSEELFTPNMEPELALSMFLGQLLYDLTDDAVTPTGGVYSAMRGHSLARNMYSYNQLGANPEDKPFIGVGRLHFPTPASLAGTGYAGDDAFLINFQFFSTDGFLRDPECYSWRNNLTFPKGPYTGGWNVPYTYPDHNNLYLGMMRPSDGMVLVPSFYRSWLFGKQGFTTSSPTSTTPNPNWTNSFGKYLTVRPRPMDQGFPIVNASNTTPITITSTGQYNFLQPNQTVIVLGVSGNTAANNNNTTPFWQVQNVVVNPVLNQTTFQLVGSKGNAAYTPTPTPGTWVPTNMAFPYPGDEGGDVKNLDWAPGGNDSSWMYINAPVITAPNGKKYTTLVAPLVLELDSRLNLNVVGNLLGAGNAHVSNQGWGPSEINPSFVLNAAGAPNEWQNIFLGNAAAAFTGQTVTASSRTYGRYGINRLPTGSAVAGGTGCRSWGPVDLNGIQDPYSTSGGNTLAWLLPGIALSPGYATIPNWQAGYGNGVSQETTYDGTAGGTAMHPLIFDAQRPAYGNRLLPLDGLAQLRCFGGTNTDTMTSDLFRLLPNNLITDANALKRRNQLTLLSAALDRVQGTPYVPDTSSTASTKFGIPATITAGVWSSTTPRGQNPINYPVIPGPLAPPTIGDFDTTTLRSLVASLQFRVDLNRTLAKYPAPDPTYGVFDTTSPHNPAANTQTQILQATTDRQTFAQDIFTALRQAAGIQDPSTVWTSVAGFKGDRQIYALRYLAQLAVNIVDFIDYDDYNTPFNWINAPAGPSAPAYSEYVYGTELPRVVINEVFAEYDNDTNDPTLATAPSWYNLNVWVELMNPLVTDTIINNWKASDGTSPWPDQQAILYQGATGAGFTAADNWPNYVVALASLTAPPTWPNANAAGQSVDTAILRDPANVTGDPDFGITPPNPFPPSTWPPAMTNIQGYKNTAVVGGTPAASIVGPPPIAPATVPRTDYLPTAAPTSPSAPASVAQATQPTYPPPAAANADYRTVWPNKNGYAVTPASSGTNVLNGGFYLLGPDAALAPAGTIPAGANAPNLATSTVRPEMKFSVAGTSDPMGNTPPGATVLVRRLACPGLPPNDPNITTGTWPYNAALPVNPYITIDYTTVQPAQVYNNLIRNGMGTALTPVPPGYAIGRTQPYAGGGVRQIQQNANTPTAAAAGPQPNQPQNTFFRQNAVEDASPPSATTVRQTLRVPFDWLPHLDRQLISPMELLQVCGYKQHELTQQFVTDGGLGSQTITAASFPASPIQITTTAAHNLTTGQQVVVTGVKGNTAANGIWTITKVDGTNFTLTGSTGNAAYTTGGTECPLVPFQQVAPWLDGTSRLYRFFEFAETKSRAAGVAMGGRVPGRININMLWDSDYEIFEGMCDAKAPTGKITNATNASPIQITTMTPHGLATGAIVAISGVVGNTNANGPGWTITYVDPNNFTLNGSSGNAGYTSGGTWSLLLPNLFSESAVYVDNTGTLQPQNDVQTVFNNFIAQRSTQMATDLIGHMPGNPTQDAPVWGFSVGPYTGALTIDNLDPNFIIKPATPVQRGITNTLLRAGSSTPTIFDPYPQDSSLQLPMNPYRRYQLLTKIYNNLTTHSNVFGVWLTVGFFEVIDDTVSLAPFKLGPEIGSADGRQVRHRMFAIVDRSQMVAFGSKTPPPPFGYLASGNILNATNASPIVITVSGTPNLVNGQTVSITGVTGNTAANGTWVIGAVTPNAGPPATTTFTLTGSTGNATYTGGGNWGVTLAYSGKITNATAATPIQITSNNHGLTTGQTVTVFGVQGNTAANNPGLPPWTITVVDPNNFTLNGSKGNGAYVPNTGMWVMGANGTTVTGSHAFTGRAWALQVGMTLTVESNASGLITNAALGTPITITSPNHGLVSGQSVTINGVTGNTNANNTTATPSWTITVVDANNFQLNGSTGNAAYLGGGTWATTNEETVLLVQPPDVGNGVMARFQNPHVAGVGIVNRGNPGPWTRYNPRYDTQVVPYFAIID
jgi:hypothetical protein